MTTKCTTAAHETLKTDRTAWLALFFVGVQVLDADDDEPAERYELRNCGCGSTLCLQVA